MWEKCLCVEYRKARQSWDYYYSTKQYKLFLEKNAHLSIISNLKYLTIVYSFLLTPNFSNIYRNWYIIAYF